MRTEFLVLNDVETIAWYNKKFWNLLSTELNIIFKVNGKQAIEFSFYLFIYF